MIKLIFLLLIATLFSSSGHRCPEIVDRDERPDLETYYQSPKGHFFIHYDTSGDNAPNPSDSNNNGIPDFVEEAALAADSSRFILTETMGFIEEAEDSDSKYDIYIKDLSSSLWGVTQYEAGGSSFIKIRNNYDEMSDYCSDSNELLWLTVAHEFFHAIQYTYRESSSDSYFREMSSMWFENVFVENCYDFLAFTDMSSTSLFSNPEGDFEGNQSGSYGYSLALYGHYLSTVIDPNGIDVENQLNTTIIRKLWEEYSSGGDVLSAIEYVLDSHYDVSFHYTWADFMSRNMFAGQSQSTLYYHPGLSIIDPPDIDFTSILEDSEMLIETVSSNNKKVNIIGYHAENFQENLSIEYEFYIDELEPVNSLIWYGNLSPDSYREDISDNYINHEPFLEDNGRVFYVVTSENSQEFNMGLNVTGYGCADVYADNYNIYADVDDGSCTYSSSVRNLYPNPVNLCVSPLYISYIHEVSSSVSLKVLDAKGMILLDKTLFDLDNGYNLIEISELNSVPSGVYFVSINESSVLKFKNIK